MRCLRAVSAMLVLAAALLVASPVSADSLESEVLYYVNMARVDNDLQPLSYADDLSGPVAIRANDIMTVFAHERPDGSEVKSLLTNSYDWFGENLAASAVQDAQKIVNAWMNSPTHRANLLNRHFTQMAVACVHGEDGHFYWAQLLASD